MSSASSGTITSSQGKQNSDQNHEPIAIEDSIELDLPVLTKSQTLDEILSEELEDFEVGAELSNSDEILEDNTKSELSSVASSVIFHRKRNAKRELQGDVLNVSRLKGVSSQLSSANQRLHIGNPSALAIHKHNAKNQNVVSQLAVGTEHACTFVFDLSNTNQIVKFCVGGVNKETSMKRAREFGRVSALSFSPNGAKLMVGYCRGHIQVIDCANGKVTCTLKPEEAHQPGKGVLSVDMLDHDQAIVLDSGGSVFKFNVPTGILTSRAIDCVFSGCRGEVVSMCPLLVSGELSSSCKHYKDACLLAMVTLTKIVVVSLRSIGSNNDNVVKFGCPLTGPPNEAPLVCWQWAPIQVSVKLKIVDPVLTFYRKGEIHFYQLHSADGIIFKPFYLQKISVEYSCLGLCWVNRKCVLVMDSHERLHMLDVSSGKERDSQASEMQVTDASHMQLVFATPDFKGTATGGNVSKAMVCLAQNVCYQSIVSDGSSTGYILGAQGVYSVNMRDWLQRVQQLETNDLPAAIHLACQFYTGKLSHANSSGSDNNKKLLMGDKIVDMVVKLACGAVGSECPTNGSILLLQDHFKSVVPLCIDACLTIEREDLLYSTVYDLFERDIVGKGYFLESLEEYVLDGKLKQLSPSIVQDYLRHLEQEGLYGSIENSIVRIPIECLDLHQVMKVCKCHDLYDGIIYVHNTALCDFLGPLQDMLQALTMSSNGVDLLSDQQIQLGNKILYYLSSCLCGRRYPVGSLPPGEDRKVSAQIYNFITRIRPKDEKPSHDDVTYPYLRILLNFDTREFLNVLSMAFDSACFQDEGADQCQRIIDILIQIFLSNHKFTCVQVGAFFAFFARLAIELEDRLIIQQHRLHKLLEMVMCSGGVESMGWSLLDEREHLLLQLMQSTYYSRVIDKNKVLPWAHHANFLLVCEFIHWQHREFHTLFSTYLKHPTKNVQVYDLLNRIFSEADLTKSELLALKSKIVQSLPELILIDVDNAALLVVDTMPTLLNNVLNIDSEQDSLSILNAIARLRQSRAAVNMCDDKELSPKLFLKLIKNVCSLMNEELRADFVFDLLVNLKEDATLDDHVLKVCRSNNLTCCVVHLLELRQQYDEAFKLLQQDLKLKMDVAVKESKCINSEEQLDLSSTRKLVKSGRTTLMFCQRCCDSGFWLALLDCLLMLPPSILQVNKDLSDLLNESVHSMVTVIKTDDVIDRVFTHPAFCNATYSEHRTLIDSILHSYNYEQILYEGVVGCVKLDGFSEFKQGRRECLLGVSSDKMGSNCVLCEDSLGHAIAVVFSCGHASHMQCLELCHSFQQGKHATKEWICPLCSQSNDIKKLNRKDISAGLERDGGNNVSGINDHKSSVTSRAILDLSVRKDDSKRNVFYRESFDLVFNPPKL